MIPVNKSKSFKGNNNLMNFYTIIVEQNGKMTHKYRTHSIRRFVRNLRTIKWQSGGIRAYLRVNYGRHFDVFGKKSAFHNDGWYERKENLWLAFNAFKEVL